jgi:hypothetical protein
MPDPETIGRMLRDDARAPLETPITIDTRAVARGARRRRLPAQLGVGAAAIALVAGFGGVAIAGMPGLVGSDGSLSASDRAEEDASGGAEPLARPHTDEDVGDDLGGSDGETMWDVLRCGEPLPPIGHTGDDRLRLELAPLDGNATVDGEMTVTGTMTNVSSERLEVQTATHLAVGLARDGVVIWSTVAMDSAALVPTLEPGASQVYTGFLELVDCGGTDPEASIRSGSPLAGAGAYEVVAALDVRQLDGSDYLTGTIVVISPRASLNLP